MAMITAALLNGLRTGLRKEFGDGFAALLAASFYKDVAMVVPSNTASNTYDWLGDFPALREWVGDRVIKDMKESAYQIANKLYEGTVGVARTHIEDDNLSTAVLRTRAIAEGAATHADKLIAALIKGGNAATCYDGQFFFDVDHPVFPNADGTGTAATISNMQAGAGTPWYLLDCSGVMKPFIFQERTKPEFDTLDNPSASDTVFIKDQYLYGVRYRCNAGYGFWQKAFRSAAALDEANFNAAFAAMQSFTGDGGKPLGITPTHLVVPPSLRAAANKLIEAQLTTGGESNTNFKAVKVLVTPWLI